jgi:hypothetical protein
MLEFSIIRAKGAAETANIATKPESRQEGWQKR